MIPHAGSYVDPSGTVFESGERILRGINANSVDFYKSLLTSPIIQDLMRLQLVKTSVTLDKIDGYGLVLEHEKLAPLSFCYEWPPEMLKDAALLTLDICLKLADEQLVLQDAYPWNVIFDGTRPVLVDYTSIVKEDAHLPWVAYDQFCRFFLYPLVVANLRSGKIMRSYLMDYINGIDGDDLRTLTTGWDLLKMPWLISRFYLPHLLVAILHRSKKDEMVSEWSARIQPSPAMRRRFFESLRRQVTAIPLRSAPSAWARYYGDMGSFFNPSAFHPKQAKVAELLARTRPKTVVDIGCNQGGYALLAAQSGARVVAFDKDEGSVTMLYRLAKERRLHILPLVNDVLCSSPACGWRHLQFPSAPQRFRSEMAIALALVHHLAITQRQNFERIVLTLSDYSDKWLLTEFVPLEDDRSRELMRTQRRDLSWYSLDQFILALQGAYRTVESFPSHPSGRTLLLCSK